MDVTTCIINLGATYGLTLPRWEETICVMIEKSPGNLLLHKLRRIFIMASDYNLALGTIVGRRLLWRAEDLNLLHKDLWGTRKDRSANDAALMKELTFGLARITNTALASFDNDAKSCYDRVVMSVGTHHLPTARSPKSSSLLDRGNNPTDEEFCQNRPWSSEEWFGNEIFRQDQTWNRTGTSGCTCHMAICLQLSISDSGHDGERVTFLQSHRNRHHRRIADGYVDDVTGFTNLFERNGWREITPARLAEVTQNDANFWHSLLNFSGGALELEKCFWYA